MKLKFWPLFKFVFSLKGLSLLLFLFATVLFAFLFHREWQRVVASSVNSWTEDHRADCAVVLTGGPGRIHEGVALLAQNNIKKLIISGVNPNSEWRQIFPLWPVYGELSENDIVLEKRSRTTYGNAVNSIPLVEALHCGDVVVVSSQLHMYRVRRVFNKLFPEDFPIVYRSVVWGTEKPNFHAASIETLKSLFYSIWAY